MNCDMNFIYFICPETPQFAKYCEGFYNYLTYGYKNWTRDRYVSSNPKDKDGRSRTLISKNAPVSDEMKTSDWVFDRIYQKVITSDCYTHTYQQITKEEIESSKQIVFITSNSKPRSIPSYLYTKHNSVTVWKLSNIHKHSEAKYSLLESKLRGMAKPYQS